MNYTFHEQLLGKGYTDTLRVMQQVRYVQLRITPKISDCCAMYNNLYVSYKVKSSYCYYCIY